MFFISNIVAIKLVENNMYVDIAEPATLAFYSHAYSRKYSRFVRLRLLGFKVILMKHLLTQILSTRHARMKHSLSFAWSEAQTNLLRVAKPRFIAVGCLIFHAPQGALHWKKHLQFASAFFCVWSSKWQHNYITAFSMDFSFVIFSPR